MYEEARVIIIQYVYDDSLRLGCELHLQHNAIFYALIGCQASGKCRQMVVCCDKSISMLSYVTRSGGQLRLN